MDAQTMIGLYKYFNEMENKTIIEMITDLVFN